MYTKRTRFITSFTLVVLIINFKNSSRWEDMRQSFGKLHLYWFNLCKRRELSVAAAAHLNHALEMTVARKIGKTGVVTTIHGQNLTHIHTHTFG